MAVELTSQITGAGPPLIILHGLYGSARNWGSVARKLGDIREIHALDARNHGAAPWTDAMDYDDMAEDVAAYMASHGIASADILGHSMGGKTAMVLALTRPELLRRLIVVDIAPVIYHHQGHIDFANAMSAAKVEGMHRRADIEAQLVSAIPDPNLRAFLMQNVEGDPGAYHWRLNLAAIVPALDALMGFPEIPGIFGGEATFLAGGKSDYIEEPGRAAILARFPKAEIVEIVNAGHWAHAEQPEKFLALVREALT